jgi:hypothetical protein
MNKLLIIIAAAGLLLSLPAVAQSTNTNQKTDPPSASGAQMINPNEGRLQDDRGRSGQVKTGSEQRQGHARRNNDERSTVRGDRQDNRVRVGVSLRGRSTSGMGVHESYEYRRGPGVHVRFGHDHCRHVIVKSRHHGHLVIRHIRRCF